MNNPGPSQPQPQPRPQLSTQGKPQATPAAQPSRPAQLQRPAVGGRPVSPRPATAAPQAQPKEGRLASLDAYRGFIMIMLAASGFGIYQMTRLPQEAPVWNVLDYDIWQQVGVHFEHSEWTSDYQWDAVSVFQWIGVSFWDLIQPAFMFMVGVAMPYSFTRRASVGHSVLRRTAHAVWRAIVLVLLGVFLVVQLVRADKLDVRERAVPDRLGIPVRLCAAGKEILDPADRLRGDPGRLLGVLLQLSAARRTTITRSRSGMAKRCSRATLLPWSKNANVGHNVDVWLLNQFPRPEGKPFEYNDRWLRHVEFRAVDRHDVVGCLLRSAAAQPANGGGRSSCCWSSAVLSVWDSVCWPANTPAPS